MPKLNAHQILKTFSAVFARISEVFAALGSYLEGETYYWIDGACWDIETGLLLQYDVPCKESQARLERIANAFRSAAIDIVDIRPVPGPISLRKR